MGGLRAPLPLRKETLVDPEMRKALHGNQLTLLNR
jgi:hypothetical protein